MGELQSYDFLRMLTIAIMLASGYYTLKVARPHLDDYTSKGKDYLWAYLAMMFLITAGSITQILRNADWRWETFAGFIISLVASRAAFRKRKSGVRPFDKRSSLKKSTVDERVVNMSFDIDTTQFTAETEKVMARMKELEKKLFPQQKD